MLVPEESPQLAAEMGSDILEEEVERLDEELPQGTSPPGGRRFYSLCRKYSLQFNEDLDPPCQGQSSVLGLRCQVSVAITIKEGPYRTTTVWDTISDLPQIKIGAAI